MNLLLLNIGNSDLRADGARPEPARPAGQQLWATYEDHTFELPIIQPCLDELFRRQPQLRLDRLVIFDTDQAERGAALNVDRRGVRLRDKDTLWFGRIIERWLREHYTPDRIAAIERRDLRDFNPSMYDEAFAAYGRELAQLYDPRVQTCWVLMAGGIPACNNALYLQAVSRFGERCRAIYQPESGEPYELNIGAQLQQAFRQASAIDALQRLDFETALQLLSPTTRRALHLLVRYGRDRLNFDFERAQQALDEAIREASGEVREFARSLRRDLDQVVERRELGPLLLELTMNAEATFINGRYADFLGRMFRFEEACLRYIVETIYGLPTDFSHQQRDANRPIWQEGIAANPHLKQYLDQKEIESKPLRYDEPTRLVLQTMLAYLTDDRQGRRADGSPYLAKPLRSRYKGIQAKLGRFSKLSELRNQSIIAHGFRGVSREDIQQAYPEGDPLADMQEIIRLLELGHYRNRLRELAEFVIDQLRRQG